MSTAPRFIILLAVERARRASVEGPMVTAPRVGILCLSAIPDDPRVRRQGDLLAEAGWNVVAIGLPGARSAPPPWRCLAIGDQDASFSAPEAPQSAAPPSSGETASNSNTQKQGPERFPWMPRPVYLAIRFVVRTVYRVLGVALRLQYWARGLARQLIYLWVRRFAQQVTILVSENYAQRVYWTINSTFRDLYRRARSEKVDLWIANDWTALPIAKALAEEQGVPYAYDTHELAVDEYAQKWKWRVLERPVIAAVERHGIMGADFVTCVSEGISRRLVEVHKLERPPTVIRNMPHYEMHDPKPTGDVVRALYHGIVAPGRGLEACIRSVALWRPEFTFTIRGPGEDAYLSSLRELTREAGVSERVIFAPPVPMVALVREAARFDIGLFALPGHSLQNFHVLPNKFFEYIMAGLALCVSDLPEMTSLLRSYDLGHSISNVTAQTIADAINGFDRGIIDRYKRNAIKAARDLNWEAEAQLFLRACTTAVASRGKEVATPGAVAVAAGRLS